MAAAMAGLRQRRRFASTGMIGSTEAGGKDSIFMAVLFLFRGIAAE
jgi:hypothetical protein